MGDFKTKLAMGKLAESQIATWLRHRGNCVLPVYEVEMGAGKGPQVFLPDSELIAPDLFVFSFDDGTKAQWIEAKHKTVFSWHRKTQRWVTGIDLHHYADYLLIDEKTPWDVFLLFLHAEYSTPARNEPWPCPTGLFGKKLSRLKDCENHRSDLWGKKGMVYWAWESLIKLANIDEFKALI